MATVQLTDLLPTDGYLLSYALPLFFASLVLTFAGAFLTLDRTRTFAPAGDVFRDKQSSASRIIAPVFRGGVGGILTGLVFGIHLTTFLSLLIPSVTSSQPLKPAAYLPVWLLASLVTSITTGRWRYLAFTASGFCGGTSLALAVSVTIHPALLTRTILVVVFALTFAVMIPLPIARLQLVLLRTSSSATGSLGLVLSIALFSHMGSWSNVWDRLWVHDDIQWGSIQEKGLSAGFFLFLVSGIGVDWWLRLKFGENPDQKWDDYLAQYAANLPPEPRRAGIFHPFTSFWSNPLLKYPRLEPIVASDTSKEKDDGSLSKKNGGNSLDHGHILRTNTRGDIKFHPLDDDSTGSETEIEHISKGDAPHANLQPRLTAAGLVISTHSLVSTALEEDAHPGVAGEKEWYQVDSRALVTPNVKSPGHIPGWTPRFLQNGTRVHITPSDDPHISSALVDFIPGARKRDLQQKGLEGSSKKHENPRWQTFWRDVDEKIRHKETARFDSFTA